MSRLRLVAERTYKRQVLDKGFIASVLSVPVIVVLTLGLVYYMVVLQPDQRPVGYVDNAALIVREPLPVTGADEKPITMIPFATKDDAQRALKAGDIQAYFVLPADYRQTATVEVIYEKAPSDPAWSQFQDFLQVNLLAGESPAIAERAAAGSNLIIRRPDGSREFPDSASFASVLPLFAIIFMALAFMMLVGLNPGQPMLAVAEEKENRTMEIIVTSISPNALIAGKVIGTVAIAGTLVAGWVTLIALSVLVAVRVLHFSWLQGANLPAGSILFALAFYIPLYIVIAALMTAIGATVVEAREGQQMSFIFIVPLMVPFYVLGPIIENLNSPAAVLLSLFPLTSPTILSLRVLMQPVPTWQIALSMSFSILAAIGAIWLAGRAVRLGMLRYGQRLSWREVFGRSGRAPAAGGQQ